MQWGDKLLKFNGQTIAYDSMGNPTSYLGATLTWQGKQKTAGGTLFYTTYYYLRNAQGDVVKLIDGSGNTVVEYIYDSWAENLWYYTLH